MLSTTYSIRQSGVSYYSAEAAVLLEATRGSLKFLQQPRGGARLSAPIQVNEFLVVRRTVRLGARDAHIQSVHIPTHTESKKQWDSTFNSLIIRHCDIFRNL